MFLPDQYEVPKSSGNYMKLEDGNNTFRILSSAVVGWEGWVEDEGKRKPERFAMEEKPTDLRKFDGQKLNHFWAFAVYNYDSKKIQVLEVTQKTVQNAIKGYVDDEEWGDPKEYDITIKKEGEKLTTKYSVIAKPHKELDPNIRQEYEETTLDLEKLFIGEDPFNEDTQQN